MVVSLMAFMQFYVVRFHPLYFTLPLLKLRIIAQAQAMVVSLMAPKH